MLFSVTLKRWRYIHDAPPLSIIACATHCSNSQLFQKEKTDDAKDKVPMSAATFEGLKFRSIGPALASGRIVDIAVNPANKSEWYIAVASGGVWKTVNAGTTFEPIFDSGASYSIGKVENACRR